jgi:hypothetical protein
MSEIILPLIIIDNPNLSLILLIPTDDDDLYHASLYALVVVSRCFKPVDHQLYPVKYDDIGSVQRWFIIPKALVLCLLVYLVSVPRSIQCCRLPVLLICSR